MNRLRALFRKELNQIRRDPKLVRALIVPPILQILLFGFALDADVNNLRIGVVDLSRTPESRELVSSITTNQVFHMTGYYASVRELEAELNRSRLDVGLVIPYRGKDVQLLLNAVNANTATIAEGYTRAIVAAQNRQPAIVRSTVALLYNPGLVGSWYIVTGVFGILLVLNASFVSAAALIKEKESGTVEQLLMTPAGSTEVIVAKVAPLLLLLMVMATIAVTVAKLAFNIPMRGNLLLLAFAAGLCLLTGIAIGTLLSTVSKSAQQAQLLVLFINPPLAVLSGALTPVEAMPKWLQPVTLFNPVMHFAKISRGVLIKGAGLADLYPHFAALAVFALVLFTIGVLRFRKQLT